MLDIENHRSHNLAKKAITETEYKSFRLTLTPREKEILDLIAQGYLNKQIAYKFNVTEQTIKNYLLDIFKKIGVHNRTEAAVKVIRLGGFL